MKNLRVHIDRRKTQQLYRSRRIAQSAQQVRMLIDQREVICFCSNDYLGLANHPRVKAAFIEAANTYGVGSGAAHLINGHNTLHHQLEEALADFTGYPRAMLFSTGYMANLGIAQALVGRGDNVLEDRLNHASLLDAARLSGARLVRYAHNDIASLRDKLASRSSGEKLVMSDAVFSMDGELAPIAQLASCCRQHDAWLMLDDAHGFGVLGKDGSGSLQHTGTPIAQVPIYMATLGKAAGTAGAFVAGGEDLIETLIQQARTGIYTTAQPPSIAAATLASLQIIEQEPERRARLHRNIRLFRQLAEQADIRVADSETAIQPVIIGDSGQAIAVSEHLFESGILVIAIRPPTVPDGTARLRITLSSEHRKQDIEQLCEALAGAVAAPA